MPEQPRFRITKKEWEDQQTNILEIKDCLLGTMDKEGFISNTKKRIGILEAFKHNVIKINWLFSTAFIGGIGTLIFKLVVF